jgi:hypothetical protein
MNTENFTSKFWVVTIMILAAAFTRLIPHPPNFTAVGAIALFGGAYLSDKKFAFIIPLLAMFLTDLVIGLHNGMASVYISFIIIVGIGIMLSQNIKFKNVITASLVSSIIFFVLTNFQMWIQGTLYAKNLSGLIVCYVAAIPFFGNSVLGDLFFAGLLFGVFAIIKSKLPTAVKIKA